MSGWVGQIRDWWELFMGGSGEEARRASRPRCWSDLSEWEKEGTLVGRVLGHREACQRSPLCSKDGPAFVSLLWSLVSWEQAVGSMWECQGDFREWPLDRHLFLHLARGSSGGRDLRGALSWSGKPAWSSSRVQATWRGVETPGSQPVFGVSRGKWSRNRDLWRQTHSVW